MTDRQALIAELRRIAGQPTEERLAVELAGPTFDFGGDELKQTSYDTFVQTHPEWPTMYAEALSMRLDPLEHWLSWLWRNEFCAACGKKGHKHHPACKCRSHCS